MAGQKASEGVECLVNKWHIWVTKSMLETFFLGHITPVMKEEGHSESHDYHSAVDHRQH